VEIAVWLAAMSLGGAPQILSAPPLTDVTFLGRRYFLSKWSSRIWRFWFGLLSFEALISGPMGFFSVKAFAVCCYLSSWSRFATCSCCFHSLSFGFLFLLIGRQFGLLRLRFGFGATVASRLIILILGFGFGLRLDMSWLVVLICGVLGGGSATTRIFPFFADKNDEFENNDNDNKKC